MNDFTGLASPPKHNIIWSLLQDLRNEAVDVTGSHCLYTTCPSSEWSLNPLHNKDQTTSITTALIEVDSFLHLPTTTSTYCYKLEFTVGGMHVVDKFALLPSLQAAILSLRSQSLMGMDKLDIGHVHRHARSNLNDWLKSMEPGPYPVTTEQPCGFPIDREARKCTTHKRPLKRWNQ